MILGQNQRTVKPVETRNRHQKSIAVKTKGEFCLRLSRLSVLRARNLFLSVIQSVICTKQIRKISG